VHTVIVLTLSFGRASVDWTCAQPRITIVFQRYEQNSLAAKITHRQGQFLAFILRFTERYGIPPSFDEMAAHFGITSPSVNGMIKTLERNGFISRIPGAARTLRVEVPAHVLPEIDFGRATHHTAPQLRQEPSPSSLAASAAIAVMDTILPMLLESSFTQDDISNAILMSAERAHKKLTADGLSSQESLTAKRLIAAEVSRWQLDGRGLGVRRYVWRRK